MVYLTDSTDKFTEATLRMFIIKGSFPFPHQTSLTGLTRNTSEMFESATVCFTEIDGFKNIARNCTPLQLFDLLNTIYKTFDARIENNDVYKVETINDSYMVASGLPERNGDRHAAEIANLCIEVKTKFYKTK